MITVQQIKDRWPLRAMLSRLGVQVPARGKFRSPFRPDKTPSCEIYRETIRDRSTGETFDSIAVFAALKGLSNGEAVKMLAEEISPREDRRESRPAPSGPRREKSVSAGQAASGASAQAERRGFELRMAPPETVAENVSFPCDGSQPGKLTFYSGCASGWLPPKHSTFPSRDALPRGFSATLSRSLSERPCLDAHATERSGGGQAGRGSRQKVARPPFRQLEAPTAGDLAELGRRRHIFDTALRTAAALGRLHFAETAEGRAWVVTDSARRVCQVRRLDGQPWERIRSKAWTAVKSEGQASWPLGAAEIGARGRVILCEGGPDWLVAHEAEPDLAVCAMLGANQSIHPEALPHFSGKRVRILAHGDRAGEEAGRKWAAELKLAGASVTAVEIAFGTALDLNDCTRLSIEAWRAHSISSLLA